jgi:hypothetical protein
MRMKHALLGSAVIAASAVIPFSVLMAQPRFGGIDVSQRRYQVGDTFSACYSVPGPGPVTITDTKADGTSSIVLSDANDGSGGCLQGAATLPIGWECLTLSAGSGGQTVSKWGCFQVVQGQDCGDVSVIGSADTADDRSANVAEDCLLQAYQQCTPATLVENRGNGGPFVGGRAYYSVQGSAGSCTISVASEVWAFNSLTGGPPTVNRGATQSCGRLSRSPDGGLLFSSCSGDRPTFDVPQGPPEVQTQRTPGLYALNLTTGAIVSAGADGTWRGRRTVQSLPFPLQLKEHQHMNDARFELLTRRLGAASSRRQLLKVFLAGTAGAVTAALRKSETRANACMSDDDCPEAQRCLAGVCVADSASDALDRPYTGGPQNSRAAPSGPCGGSGQPVAMGRLSASTPSSAIPSEDRRVSTVSRRMYV